MKRETNKLLESSSRGGNTAIFSDHQPQEIDHKSVNNQHFLREFIEKIITWAAKKSLKLTKNISES